MKTGFQKNLWVGVALILLGIILVFGRSQDRALNASFENEPVNVSGLKTGESSGNLPKRIIIPALSIDLAVEKSDIVDGYWEVHENIAGWGDGSGLPGQMGNQVIFAHAREALFLPLKDVEKDMNIYVIAESEGSDAVYVYSIVDIKEVYPSQTEVIEPTDDETLTLYTCSGFSDEKRLIVIGKRTLLN